MKQLLSASSDFDYGQAPFDLGPVSLASHGSYNGEVKIGSTTPHGKGFLLKKDSFIEGWF